MSSKKGNNNKSYGLCKERDLKRLFSLDPLCLHVVRSRGSFGRFDLLAFYIDHIKLISVKSVRSNYNPAPEIKKLSSIVVPGYCQKFLYIWWSSRSVPVKLKKKKLGWEVIPLL